MASALRFLPTGERRHAQSLVAATWCSSTLLTASDDCLGQYNGEGEWQGALVPGCLPYGLTDLHSNPVSPELVAGACSDGCLRLYTVAGGWREERRVAASAAGAAIVSVRWSHDGSAVCTGGEDGCVKVWSRAGALRTTLATCASPVYAVRWGGDSNSVAWASGCDLFQASLSAEAALVGVGGGGKGSASSTASAASAASAPASAAAAAASPAGARHWRAHEGVVLALDVCPTSGRIVSGGEDGRFKLWDSLGRPLATGPAEEHVVTACAWAPSGRVFAVGAHGVLLLCDPTGNVRCREGLGGWAGKAGSGAGAGSSSSSSSGISSGISAAGASGGAASLPRTGAAQLGSSGSGVQALSWCGDGELLAIGTGGGALLLAAVVARREVSPSGYEATLSDPCRLLFTDTAPAAAASASATAGASASKPAASSETGVEFRDRVCQFSLGFGHAVVATPTQLHVFSQAAGWATPSAVLDTPKAPACLLLQSSRGFAALDSAGGLSAFSYDGRPVPACPKLPEGALKPRLCSASTLALGPDCLVVLEGGEYRSVRSYELRTGRALSAGPYVHPQAVAALGVSQGCTGGFGSLAERRLALLDGSGDLYLCGVQGRVGSAAGVGGGGGRRQWRAPTKQACSEWRGVLHTRARRRAALPQGPLLTLSHSHTPPLPPTLPCRPWWTLLPGLRTTTPCWRCATAAPYSGCGPTFQQQTQSSPWLRASPCPVPPCPLWAASQCWLPMLAAGQCT